jgi:hypothetical protein
MFNKHQEKKRMESILDAHTPHIEAYEKKSATPNWSNEKKKRKYVLWGSLGGGFLTAGICAAVIISSTVRFAFHPSYQVVTPKAREVDSSYNAHRAISEMTKSVYKSFCVQMTPYVFTDYAKSRSFSVVDAFVNLCLVGYASSDAISSVVVKGLGASSRDDLKVAAKEIIMAVGTPDTAYNDLAGGFSLQSIWLSEKLALADDLGTLKADLEDSFYCSVFHHQPTTGEVNKYYTAETPEEFSETPSSAIPDGTDSASISSFYLIDKYGSTESLKYTNEYRSGTHLMDYHLQGMTRRVNYIEKRGWGKAYINDHFIGADSLVTGCSFAYFLPDEGYSPKDIAADVFKENYTRQGYDEKTDYDTIVKAPYFTINNTAIDLLPAYKNAGFNIFDGTSGLFGRLLKDESAQFAFASSQSSIINYDYNGLYSASRTVFTGAGATAPAEKIFRLTLDRPYVFRVDSPSVYVGTSTTAEKLPIIYGQIYDPAYQGR